MEHAVPVKISSDDFDIVTETRNISCSGAFCQVGKRLAPMTKLKVHLLLPVRSGTKTVSKRIDCGGVVVRAQSAPQGDRFNTAIFFSDIKPRDSAAIARFVADRLPHGLAAGHIDGPHDDAPSG
ncbi:MAG: PilZ domain-containing protein [Candidatus Omnitrophica bacterium]|nr:PilZ domain-containing protein [Candidatus Omnitrophota bacterium]